MAEQENSNMQLFADMKRSFPEIPEDVIYKYVAQNVQDKKKCFELLKSESEHYMYGSSSLSDSSDHFVGLFNKKSGDNGLSDNVKDHNNSIPCSKHLLSNSVQSTTKLIQKFNSDFIAENISRENRSDGNHLCGQGTDMNSSNINGKPDSIGFDNTYDMSSQNNPVVSPSESQGIDQKLTVHDYPCKIDKSTKLPVEKGNITTDNTLNNELKACGNQQRHVSTLNIFPTPPHFYQNKEYCLERPTVSGNIQSSFTTTTTATVASNATARTSFDLQLCPPSNEPHTYHITTVPKNLYDNSDIHGFDSQVQISLSPTSASFSTWRTYIPQNSVTSKEPITKPVNMYSGYGSDTSSPQLSSGYYTGVRPKFSPTHDPSSNYQINQRFPITSSVNDLQKTKSNQMEWLQNNHVPLTIHLPSTFENKETRHLVSPDPSRDNSSTDIQDEQAYINVLLYYQKARLDMLCQELEQKKEIRSKLHIEVRSMEEELMQQKLERLELTDMNELQKLAEEIRALRVECYCLSTEVDLQHKGQVPLGMTDEDFYKNIFTGPAGPVPPVPTTQSLGTDKEEDGNKWECSKCTFENHPALNKCEMCDTQRSA